MVTNPSPLPATLSTPEPADTSSQSTRTGRLRSLSYLRNYTQSHLFQQNSSTSPTRSRKAGRRNNSQQRIEGSPDRALSSDDPETRLSPSINTSAFDQGQPLDNHIRRRSPGRWLPAVGGLSGLSRVSAQSTDTPTTSPSVEVSDPERVVLQGAEISTAAMARTRTSNAAQSSYRGLIPTYSAAAVEFSRLDGSTNGNNESNQSNSNEPATTNIGSVNQNSQPTIRFIAHQDSRSNSRPSLQFQTISRVAPTDSTIIKVGRYSEKEEKAALLTLQPSSGPVGFKSKVVSRRHCEFWCRHGQWYIRDVRSSSGTFLNHIRLSQPNIESRPFPVNDGDVVQLGIDFKGGEEMIFRCVKIKVECNRGWQKSLNSFNMSTHKQLRTMTKAKPKGSPKGGPVKSDAASTGSTECSICLFPVAPCQSLFVAPCSHVWHFKCIRPILNGPTWPQFLCPNCRAVSDLEAEVDEPTGSLEEWEDDEDLVVEDSNDPSGQESEQARDTNINGISTFSNVDTNSDDGISNDVELAHVIEAVTQSTLEAEHTPKANASMSNSSNVDSTVSAQQSGRAISPIQLDSVDGRAQGSILTARIGEARTTDRHLNPVNIQTANSTLDTATDGQPSEGPMTPRNDAGPFVFDGSGSQESARLN